jgi:putative glutamine amidotransferase
MLKRRRKYAIVLVATIGVLMGMIGFGGCANRRAATQMKTTMTKKLKIGVTQRTICGTEYLGKVHVSPEKHDELSQGWAHLLEENGFVCVPIPNACDVAHFIESLQLDGVLLSGGNDDATREACESACIAYCIQHRLPLFGVCRGMQVVGLYFGSKLVPIASHVNVTHTVKILPNPYIQESAAVVNSYHNFTLNRVPEEFIPLAVDDAGHCEAMYHRTLPIVTFMWHPEREPFLPWFNRFIQKFYGQR